MGRLLRSHHQHFVSSHVHAGHITEQQVTWLKETCLGCLLVRYEGNLLAIHIDIWTCLGPVMQEGPLGGV